MDELDELIDMVIEKSDIYGMFRMDNGRILFLLGMLHFGILEFVKSGLITTWDELKRHIIERYDL